MILIVNTTSDTALTDAIRQTLAAPGTAPETAPGTAPETALGTAPETVPAARAEFEIVEAADDYEEILKKMIHADQIWVISGTALGFLDHKGKNIFDRIMPLVTMYLKFKGDQMRHVMRYRRNADIGLIYAGEADRTYLMRWNERAALNIGTKSLGVFPAENWKEAVACMH